LLGDSIAIQQVREIIARVASLPTSILFTGQSGTGKEVAARSLHALSNRANKVFVPVNCSAIPPDMIESELFGHLKGAFTGASGTCEGLFLHAQGGTVFLDEIGELPYEQAAARAGRPPRAACGLGAGDSTRFLSLLPTLT
jgi:DNA-binding NtrC family response regulator